MVVKTKSQEGKVKIKNLTEMPKLKIKGNFLSKMKKKFWLERRKTIKHGTYSLHRQAHKP